MFTHWLGLGGGGGPGTGAGAGEAGGCHPAGGHSLQIPRETKTDNFLCVGFFSVTTILLLGA
ncbi:hypothetical protein D3C81_1729150 [compost metagenome]